MDNYYTKLEKPDEPSLNKPEEKHLELNEKCIRISDNAGKMKKILSFSKYATIFTITLILVFSNQVLVSEQGSSSWIANLPIIKQIRSLVESAEKGLKGEDRDRINILLLGMGGKQHEGGYLTDTLMLASLEPSTKKVALISIPRDLSVPIENMGWQKINHVNAYAENETAGSGGLAASQAVSDVLDMPIDYYLRVDFNGFVNIIDELGGINIYVENTIDDLSYPILGKEDDPNYNSRYEHLYIEKGWHKMDGSLALKYARSRHTAGVEGSDFARARRQQKIMEAVKDEILSMHTLLNPRKVSNIIEEGLNHVNTNLKVWEILKLWNTFKDVKKEDIINKVLDNSDTGLLVNSISPNGAYILSPRSGDFAEIQYFVNSIFSDAPEEQTVKISHEKSSVEVRNGTWINGLASKTAVDLERYGFKITRIANSSRQNFEKSVIYDLTYGEKMESLSILKDKTGANISFGLPDWLTEEIAKDVSTETNPTKPDFILILGQNADNNESGGNNPEDGLN